MWLIAGIEEYVQSLGEPSCHEEKLKTVNIIKPGGFHDNKGD